MATSCAKASSDKLEIYVAAGMLVQVGLEDAFGGVLSLGGELLDDENLRTAAAAEHGDGREVVHDFEEADLPGERG